MPRYFSKLSQAFNPSDYPTINLDNPESRTASIGTIVRSIKGSGSYFIRDDRQRSWQTILKEDLRSGQPYAYADTVNESLITFSGGAPSASPGWHLPFATMPPFDDGPKPGRQILDRHSHLPEAEAWAGRRRDHEQRIKDIVKPLMRWVTDKTVGEPRDMGHAWLEEFVCVEALPFSTTWRARVVIPYMD